MKTLEGVVTDCVTHPKGGWSADVHFDNEVPVGTRLVQAEQAATKAAPGKRLTREQIREVFMANGFTVKEGQTDLKQYVYDAAHALLELVAAHQPAPPPLKRSECARLIRAAIAAQGGE